MQTLIAFITGLGALAVAGVIYAESGLLIGFFLPGDSLLFTAGILTQQGVLGINIHLFVLLLFVAAVLGDNTGYYFGKKVGRRIFTKKDSLLFQQENITRAERFYEKHGPKTIVLARFIPVIRTFAPIVAGVGSMRYRTFVAYNLLGAVLWTAGNTYLGYYVGAWLESMGLDVEQFVVPFVLLIVITSVAPAAYHILKEPARRAQVTRGLKKAARKLFARQ